MNLLFLAIAIISTVFDIILGLNVFITSTTIFFTIFYLITYIFLKKGRFLKQIKILLTISIYVALTLTWFFNYGSKGPAGFILLVLSVFIVIVWGKKPAMIFLAAGILNALVLFFVELSFPEISGQYPSNVSRIADLLFGVIVAFLIISYYLLKTKENYSTQFQRAMESDMLKSLFLRNISHEIRTPLNAITGFSELIAREETPQDDKEMYSKIIADNSNSLSNLINNILDVSNLESNQLILKYNCFNVANMVNRIVSEEKSLLEMYGKHEIVMNCHFPSFDIILNSDETRIEQIIRNLIDNSIKYTHEGTIDVWIKKENNKFFFSITDTGIGIGSKHIERIFDRFYKVSETDTPFSPGTGIGLYLVKELLKLLKGDITVKSEPGMGSTFTFYVPDYAPETGFKL